MIGRRFCHRVSTANPFFFILSSYSYITASECSYVIYSVPQANSSATLIGPFLMLVFNARTHTWTHMMRSIMKKGLRVTQSACSRLKCWSRISYHTNIESFKNFNILTKMEFQRTSNFKTNCLIFLLFISYKQQFVLNHNQDGGM